MPNYNPDTGIPYGTIYLHHIDSDLAQELWYTHGEDISYKNALEEFRSEVRAELLDSEPDVDPDDIEDMIDSRCEWFESQIDEPTIEGEYEGVKYMISWLGGAPLLWVFSSPFTGSYAQCSPCVPGAGDLKTPDEYGVVCYDVPPDWRRDEDHWPSTPSSA